MAERWPAGVRLAFFLANLVEAIAKNLPIHQRIELRKEVVDLINFVKLVFDVEKRILTSVFAHDRTPEIRRKDEKWKLCKECSTK